MYTCSFTFKQTHNTPSILLVCSSTFRRNVWCMLLEIPLCVSVTRRNVLYLLLYGSSCSLEGTSCISTTHLVMKSCTTGSVPAKIFLVVLCFFACHFILFFLHIHLGFSPFIFMLSVLFLLPFPSGSVPVLV